MVPRRILPERVFGSRFTTITDLKAATGPISSRTSLTTSASMSLAGRLTPAFSTRSPRDLPLHGVGDADDGAFGHVLVLGHHLLHLARRQAMAGDVDDVVGARHHEDVAVGVA